MTNVLSDTDPMPFGKHKGVQLGNVPASYLLWLYDQIKPSAPNKRLLSQKYLMAYIEENMEVLKKQKSEEKN